MHFSISGVFLGFVLTTLFVGISGCQFSTARITQAAMVIGVDSASGKPTESTDAYRMWMPTLTCSVELANAPSGTTVMAVWQVNIDGTFQVMDSTEKIAEHDGWLYFRLTRGQPAWAYGEYKVDVYLNDVFDRTVPFRMEPTYTDNPISEIILTTGPTETGSPMPPQTIFPSSMDPICCFVYAFEPEVPVEYGVAWYQVVPEGVYSVARAKLIHETSGWIQFSLQHENPLPSGRYYADILVNSESFGKMEFTIE